MWTRSRSELSQVIPGFGDRGKLDGAFAKISLDCRGSRTDRSKVNRRFRPMNRRTFDPGGTGVARLRVPALAGVLHRRRCARGRVFEPAWRRRAFENAARGGRVVSRRGVSGRHRGADADGPRAYVDAGPSGVSRARARGFARAPRRERTRGPRRATDGCASVVVCARAWDGPTRERRASERARGGRIRRRARRASPPARARASRARERGGPRPAPLPRRGGASRGQGDDARAQPLLRERRLRRHILPRRRRGDHQPLEIPPRERRRRPRGRARRRRTRPRRVAKTRLPRHRPSRTPVRRARARRDAPHRCPSRGVRRRGVRPRRRARMALRPLLRRQARSRPRGDPDGDPRRRPGRRPGRASATPPPSPHPPSLRREPLRTRPTSRVPVDFAK